MKNIEEQYNKLKNKYDLPKFEDLDRELEIRTIENEKFLLREIINKLMERIDFFSKILEEILQPDTSLLSSIHETRCFGEREKEDIYDLYKKLMVINRESVEVSLKTDEKEESLFINKVFNEWKELKNDLLKFANKIKESWKIESDIKEELSYLG